MQTLREKRTITSEEKKYLLSIKLEDIDLKLLQSLFADTYDPHKKKRIPSKFNTYDEFTLEKGEYTNKETIKTNCGLFIVNKYLFEKNLVPVVGYVNEAFTKKKIGSIYSQIDAALLEDRLTSEQYIDFLNRLCWLAFSFNTEVSTSLTVHAMKELPEVTKKRKELINKNKEAFTTGSVDIATVTKVEKELVDVAKDAMKGDPALDLYNSGARGAFNVAYKNGQIMKGPIYNASTGEWEVIKDPLVSGATKEDVPAMANASIESAYNKAIAPGDCGYMTKKLSAAFQSVTLDKKGTDCGTKGYSVFVLDDHIFNLFKYGYMVEGSKLVRLDSSNYDKYKGKTVKLRSADYCIGKKICNKCAGDLYYMLGMENIGLTTPRISGSMLNGRMKQGHDSTIKTYEVTEDDFL